MLRKKTIGILSALAITALVISLGTGLVLAEEADVPEQKAAAVEVTAESEETADVTTDGPERICPITDEVCTREARYTSQNRPGRAASGEEGQMGDQQRLQIMDGTCEIDPEAAQARRETQRSETQRSETQRSETPRSEAPRSETPRGETQRSETQRSETQRSEAGSGCAQQRRVSKNS